MAKKKEAEDSTRIFTWKDVFYIIDHDVDQSSDIARHLGVAVSAISSFRTRLKTAYDNAPPPSADELRVIPHRDRCVLCRIRRQTVPTADGKKHLCETCDGLVEAFNNSGERSLGSPQQPQRMPPRFSRDQVYEDTIERRTAPGGSWDRDNR